MVVSDFIHPEDAATLRELKTIPGLPQIMKKIYEYGLEDIMWSNNVATNIRLSESQMPQIYRLLPPICRELNIQVPELYMNMTPYPNAWTSGNKRVYIVITMGLVKRLSEEELTAVLAHECGHIACEHVIYSTLAEWIYSLGENLTDGGELEKVLGKLINIIGLKALRQKLFAWERASELTADRVGCYCTSALTMIKALAKLERIPPFILKEMDFYEWARQGEDYEKLKQGNTWNKIVRWVANSDMDHPYGPVRAHEVLVWEHSKQYNRLSQGITCPKCGAAINADWKYCKKCGCSIN
ncbi:MAG: M48 family metallopeptidase [Bacteroidales bacterium]|nr:M48 family metallopeptidase [Bacteroidales bacterium]